MITQLLLVSSLIFGINSVEQSKNNNTILSSSLTWEYVNEIEDGAIYFIRNALLSSQVIDVPNGNYSEGKDMIIFNYLGWANQRFSLNKDSTTNGYTTYNIMPIEDYNKVLSIQGENSNEDSPLEIKNQSTFVSNLNHYKFAFEPGSTENSFRILTGASNFTKYLTLDNYSVADNTKIVQKTFDPHYEKCFDWHLQKK